MHTVDKTALRGLLHEPCSQQHLLILIQVCRLLSSRMNELSLSLLCCRRTMNAISPC